MELCDQQRLVLHVESGVIGRARRYYLPGEWTSPVNDKAVDGSVLELDTGDAFLVKDGDTFLPLTPAESAAYEGVTAVLTEAMRVSMVTAAKAGLTQRNFLLLATSALETQRRQLGAAVAAACGVEKDDGR